MPGLDPLAANWFEKRRGIKPETVEAFGIYTEGRDLVIPYPDGLLKRRYSVDEDNPFGLEKDERRFKWEDTNGGPAGAGQVPFLPPDFVPRERMILCEGETDTMAVWQALKNADLLDKVGVVGLSGTGSWAAAVMGQDKKGVQIRPSRLEELFGPAKRVFVVFDNDDPYENPEGAESVERAWRAIREALSRKARRVKLPQGPSDVAEFFMSYDWAAFEVLLTEAAKPRFNFAAINWKDPVPDTDWLLYEVIEKKSLTLLHGLPGSGKSFFTMALAAAIVRGDTHFLGQEIRTDNRRVLYVDEENNYALVRQRLHALGFREEEHGELWRYVHKQGLNLRRDFHLFLEDALEMDPGFIVFDSQAKVSAGAKENDNDEMTEFYTEHVQPLTRYTDAALTMIHHANKASLGTRGAGAIDAQADQVLSIINAESGGMKTNRYNIFPSKPRREGEHLAMEILGSLEHDEELIVQAVGGTDAF